MKPIITINPDTYDHDNIEWEWGGYWFIWKEWGDICITKCPKCFKQNYAMVVFSWICNWCRYNPNK